MGITLREVIYDIGGGIPGGRKFKAVQIGRPVRGLPPQLQARPAHRLRKPDRGRVDHGLGRDDRHGREDVHGRHRQIFPQFPPRRILRQVRFLPRRNAADVGDRPSDITRARANRATSPSSRSWRTALQGRLDVRPRPDGGQSRPLDPCAISETGVRGPHQRETLPGRRLRRPHPATSVIPDKCTGCLACKTGLPQGLPSRERSRKSTRSNKTKCIKCGACYEACKFEAIETERDEAIAIVEGAR